MTLRIAHVLSSFGLGGQERMVVDLARLQRAAGHHVQAVSLAPGPHGPIGAELARLGVDVDGVPRKPRGIDMTEPLRLARVLRGADIVHTHNPVAMVYGAVAGRLVGARVVHTKHGLNPATRRARLLRRLVARQVDAFVAVSTPVADQARRDRDCAAHKLLVVKNGVDAVRFAPDPAARREVRRELGIAEEARLVGTVGRLSPEKDQVTLLRAMTPLATGDVHLLLLGDGPEREALAAAVPGVCRSNVHMPGVRTDVPRVMAALDIFALSSRFEGLPLVLLEAMATGLPVVTTSVGGIPEVIREGRTGFMVPAGDASAMGARIEALLGDPDARRAMGQRGRELVLVEHTIAATAARYEEIYAGRPRSSPTVTSA